MARETTPEPNPNNETERARSIFNKFKDRKLFDEDGNQVAMNITAMIALFIIMEKMPDVKTDVTFRNFKEGDKRAPVEDNYIQLVNPEDAEFELLLSPERPDMRSEKGRFINIKRLAQIMNLPVEDITEDMANTFAIIREIGHYFNYRGKTGVGIDMATENSLNEIEKVKKELVEKELKEKLEEELFIIESYYKFTDQVMADKFAEKWMSEHMYLFNPDVNPYLGQWSVEPEQQYPPQAGVIYLNSSLPSQ